MTSENKKTHRTLNLFRKGLRLHDNEPLHHAISTSEVVFPVYIMGKYLEIKLKIILIIDIEWQREQEKFGVNKMKFMLECLHDLDLSLKKMGTRLFVLKGDALTVIKQFCKE